MLRITLYKNCILNETYANVFSMGKIQNKSILERYLDTLSKKVYDIDYVYQENAGQLVFEYDIDLMSNIYDFNYMKVETIDEEDEEPVKILRYCFINEIILKNELVYLSYSEDMWHSYIDKIDGITESYLDASRIIDYENNFKLKVRSLPFEYKGNKPIDMSILIGNEEYTNAKFLAIVEFQLYTLDSQGNPTERIVKQFAMDFSTTDSEIAGMLLSPLIRHLNLIEQYKSNHNVVSVGTTPFSWHYEIGDIYIIPIEFGIISEIERQIGFRIDLGNNVGYNLYEFKALKYEYFNDNKLKTIKSLELSNNFKLLSLGTLNSQVPIVANGNSIEIKLLFSCSKNNIGFYLNINNSLIDITKDFYYQLAVNGINSEEMSLLKLARETKVANYKNDIELSNINASEKKFAASEKIAKAFELDSLRPSKLISSLARRGTQIASGTASIVHANQTAHYEQETIKNKITEENAPLYSSSKGVIGNSCNYLNSRYGIVALFVNSQNDDFVKRAINNMGYIAYEFINDISKLRINDANYFIEKNINYNVISFKSVSCYGSFVRNTAKTLNEILETGVKIWYNENLQEDNYQVG